MDYFFFLSIISSLIIIGEAIKCYECSHCTDLSTSKKVIRDCPESPKGAACMIMSYVLSNYSSGVRGRGCSVKSLVTDERSVPQSVDVEDSQHKVYVRLLSMFYCDFDFCNKSSLVFPKVSTIVFILSIHLLYNIY